MRKTSLAGLLPQRVLQRCRLAFLYAAFGVFGAAGCAAHSVWAADEKPTIVLHTHDEELGGDTLVENPAIDTIRCILERMGRPVEIRRGPRFRNVNLLAAGRIDGIFPNLPDEKLDEASVGTEPFVLERWSYVQRQDSLDPDQPNGQTVGVILGSNESRFLTLNHVDSFDAIPNLESLIKLLASRRVAYVMVDDWSFGEEANALGFPADAFRSSIVRYVPLQAYFSKPFVEANPGFISRFNETIQDCVHEGRRVAPWEKAVLQREADTIIDGAGPAILQLLRHYQTLDRLDPLLSRIDTLAGEDEVWRKAQIEDRMSTLMEVILANPLSDLLRKVAAEHPSITEIFAVNEDGFIVGLNRLTSDYWQGDEDAAGAILGNGEELHFSAFEYDLSTRRFQVKVSMPLFDPQSGPAPIGMITIGLDAASLLTGQTD